MKKNKKNKRFKHIIFIYLLFSFTLITVSLNIFRIKNWQFYTNNVIAPLEHYDNLIIDQKSIIFNNKNGKTYSISQENGNINWEFPAESYSPLPPIIDHQQILLANFDGNIYSLDKNNGLKNWQFHIGEAYQPDTPILVSKENNLAFFAGRNGVLYALDKNKGQLIWSQQFQQIDTTKAFNPQGVSSIHFGPIYLDNEEIYAVNAVENSFTSLDQKTGKVNWKINDIDFVWTSPIFFKNDIVLLQNDHLISIEKDQGTIEKKINKKNPESQSWAWQIFKIKKDTQYFLIQDDQNLLKIANDLQRIQWQAYEVDSILINEELNLVFTQQHLRLENQNKFTAINYKNGRALWSISLDGKVLYQFHLNEELILGGENGSVISLDYNTGQINWEITVSESVNKIFLIKDKFLVLEQKPGNKIELTLLKEDGEIVWQYVPDSLINFNEIYEYEGGLYFIDANKQIINKIVISSKNPLKEKTNKTNFTQEETPIYHQYDYDPYWGIEEKKQAFWPLKKQWSKIKYITKNFRNIYKLEINENKNSTIFEISLKHDENLYHNKFKAITIEADFYHPDLDKIKTKGFYYDHNTWKIRFAAPISGEYQYKIKIISPYFIKKISGSTFLEQTQKDPIAINDNFFTINNEKAFFPIGIQNVFFDRNYDGNVLKEIPNSLTETPVAETDQFSYTNFANYLNIFRNEANINIFRYGIGHWSPALINDIDYKNFSLDMNAGKFADNVISTAKNKNIKIIMTIFDFYPPFKNREEIAKKRNRLSLQLYLDYIIARFGPFVDFWELSNEAEASHQWYEFVIQYLKNNDPYNRPISTNWQSNSAKKLDFQSLHHYAPDVTYPGLLASELNYLLDKFYDSKMPILISELGFKNYSYFKNSADSMRILSWIGALQNVGIVFWNQGQNKVYENPNNANIYLGPVERSYLLSLSQFLPEDLYLPIEKKLILIPELETQAYILKNNDFILAYLLKFDKNKQNKEYLNLNLAKEAKIQWLDPKTNTIIEEQIIMGGEQKILIPNFKVDLAMKIHYITE